MRSHVHFVGLGDTSAAIVDGNECVSRDAQGSAQGVRWQTIEGEFQPSKGLPRIVPTALEIGLLVVLMHPQLAHHHNVCYLS